jgi:hypothetical protein
VHVRQGTRLQERYRTSQQRNDKAETLKLFKRAVRLKDAPSCHVMALLLDQPKDAKTRRRFLEPGVLPVRSACRKFLQPRPLFK